MKVELRHPDAADAYIIKNMWPLYLQDLSAFDGRVPNRHGVLHDDDEVCTVAEQCESLSNWWSKPDVLFPCLIRADGRPAGFNLIASGSALPPEVDADFVVYELFVLRAFRGERVAEQAALQGFERHPGRWEVVTYPNHGRAIAFWRRTIGACAPRGYSEQERDHVFGRKVVFEFDSSAVGATDVNEGPD